jgi:hypothetical protein
VEGVLDFCVFLAFFPTEVGGVLCTDPSVSESVSRIARTMGCALAVSAGIGIEMDGICGKWEFSTI